MIYIKTAKQLFYFILSLVMVFSLLTACGNSYPSEDTTQANESVTAPVPSSETPTEATSPQTSATVLSAEKDAELHTNLQARIDEILNTETEIVHSDTFIPGETYTGTAYYVSNDGDDNNDGLTPETAWKTLNHVSRASGAWDAPSIMKPGDAIFLRRGDIFACFTLYLQLETAGLKMRSQKKINGDKGQPLGRRP